MNICPGCGSEQDHTLETCLECSAELDLNGRYRLIKVLNVGMAHTFLAVSEHDADARISDTDPTKARFVIKRIEVAELDDWKHLDLFKREADVLRRLEHSNIPAYVDDFADEERGHFYIVQNYIAAPSVERVAKGGSLNETRVFDIGRQVLEILDYLHKLSPPVIHRDIKPDNLLIDKHDRVWLVDFGTVRAAARNTMSGGTTVVGTLGYMAPEQFYGQASPSTDLFGLGATMLRLLSGRHPADFPHDGIEIDLRGQLEHLSPRGRAVIATLMRPRPSERPQSVDVARRLFGPLGSSPPPQWSGDAPGVVSALNHVGRVLHRSLTGAPAVQQPPQAPNSALAPQVPQRKSVIMETVDAFGELVDALTDGLGKATSSMGGTAAAKPPQQSQKALPPPPSVPSLPPPVLARPAPPPRSAALARRDNRDQLPQKTDWKKTAFWSAIITFIILVFLL